MASTSSAGLDKLDPLNESAVVRQVDLDLALVDALIAIARHRGRCRQNGLTIHLDLGFVAGGMKDLVTDAEGAATRTPGGLALVAEVDPSKSLRRIQDDNDAGDDDYDNNPRLHASSVRARC